MPKRSSALFLLISLMVAAICVRLGFWQLARLRQRRASNAVAYAARALPAVALPGPHGELTERRLIARGTYDEHHDLVVRGRVYEEAPGVDIVTPLRLAGSDTAILVLRGFVPAGDALSARPDTLPEPGPQVVRGIALPLDSASDRGDPRIAGGIETWRHLDRAMGDRLPYPVLPVFIMQQDDPTLPRWPRRLDPPVLDEGPHESYAIQWFAFALIFGGGGLIWAWRRGKQETAPTSPE